MARDSFVSRLPDSSRLPRCRVEIGPLERWMVDWWHQSVQPKLSIENERADSNWCWKLFTSFNQHNWFGRPEGFAISLRAGREWDQTRKQLLPIALLQMRGEVALPESPHTTCVYVEYMSTLPRDLLPTEKNVRLVGQSTLDIAIVRAFQNGSNGRTALGIGPRKRRELEEWYSRSCRMTRSRHPELYDKLVMLHTPRSAEIAYDTLNFLRVD